MIGEEPHKAGQVKRTQQQKKPNTGARPKTDGAKRKVPANMEGKCWRCGNPGHSAPECKLPSTVKCTKCDRLGHHAKACFSKVNQVQATAKPKEKAQPKKKEESDDDSEGGEQCKTVVVYRSKHGSDTPPMLL